MVISERTENSFFAMDYSLWLRVRKAREAAGLPLRTASREEVQNHPLVGQRLLSQSGAMLTVDRVVRDWFVGWFEVAHLRDVTHAQGIVDAAPPVRNLSSRAPDVVAAVKLFPVHYSSVSA